VVFDTHTVVRLRRLNGNPLGGSILRDTSV
jgi:hypothetical protein